MPPACTYMSGQLKNILFVIGAVGALACFQGCSRDGAAIDSVRPGTVVTNEERVAWRDLPSSAPLVVIGSLTLTKGDLLNSVSNDYFALVARGAARKEIRDKFDRNRTDLAAQHVSRFLHQSAFLLRADELGIDVDEGAVAAQWLAVSNVAKKTGVDIVKFANVNGHRSLGDLDRYIRDNLRLSKVFSLTFSNRLEVAQQEVDELHARLEAGNRAASATNAIYLAELKKLRQDLIAKGIVFEEDDEANAKKVPEGVKVEWFVKAPGNSFDEEETVVGKIRYQSVNTWSEIFEGDGDYSIYFMKEIEQKSAETPTLFTGFRVFREKDHGFMVPEKGKLLQDLRKRRNIQVVTPEFERLCRHFGVLYPNGFVWRDSFK